VKYRELSRRPRALGCEFVQNGADSHRIWWNPTTGRYTTIPDWGARDLSTGTLRGIASDLGVDWQAIQKQ
jgi:predicted RNA binding protein YcfA (HicA-like mRNA interferase family)